MYYVQWARFKAECLKKIPPNNGGNMLRYVQSTWFGWILLQKVSLLQNRDYLLVTRRIPFCPLGVPPRAYVHTCRSQT